MDAERPDRISPSRRHRRAALGALAALTASTLVACSPTAGPPKPPWTASLPISSHEGRPGTDVTFFVVADPQYHSDVGKRDVGNLATIGEIQRLAASDSAAGWPDGERLREVRGVIIAGDLTHLGDGEPCDDEGQCGDGALGRFDHHWTGGVNGRSLVGLPVYEGLGNHDERGLAIALLKARNASGRPVLNPTVAGTWRMDRPTATSPEGHYSWDWDGVHLVQLNDHAGGRNPRTGEVVDGPRAAFAMDSLAFLERDLAEHAADGRSVILVQHLGFDPFSSQARAELQPCDGSGGQRWRYELARRLWVNDAFDPPRCLGPVWPNSPQIGAVQCDERTAIRWSTADGRGRITHLDDDECLIAEDKTAGTRVKIGDCDDNNPLGWTWQPNQVALTSGGLCLTTRGHWWTEAERRALLDVTEGYNVVALFSGHMHRYFPNIRAMGGLLNMNPGAAHHGQLLAVHIDDQRVRIARRCATDGGHSGEPDTWIWAAVNARGCSVVCEVGNPSRPCFVEVGLEPSGPRLQVGR